jgi:hypothetical protein
MMEIVFSSLARQIATDEGIMQMKRSSPRWLRRNNKVKDGQDRSIQRNHRAPYTSAALLGHIDRL